MTSNIYVCIHTFKLFVVFFFSDEGAIFKKKSLIKIILKLQANTDNSRPVLLYQLMWSTNTRRSLQTSTPWNN